MAKIKKGSGPTEYGPGIEINLTGAEVAIAIEAYLMTKRIYIRGPRTITVNGELCKAGEVYIDPSGFVVKKGIKYEGSTGEKESSK
jgi:hypothetical protein